MHCEKNTVNFKQWRASPDVSKQEKEETEILDPSILTRRKNQGEFHGLNQELKQYFGRFRTYFRTPVGQVELFWLSVDHIWGGREITSEKPSGPEQRALVAKYGDLIGLRTKHLHKIS